MITPEQHKAAKVAGVIYLAAMASSMFAELYAQGGQVTADAAETARNIAATESLFRLGAVTHLVTFANDAALAVALYLVLSPVSRGLALLGAFWRLVDCAVLAISALAQFSALRLLTWSHPPQALGPDQLQAQARLLLEFRGEAMSVGWVFLGLGSIVFSWLWLRSRYVPRPLAAWGVFASALLAVGPLVAFADPAAGRVISPGYMIPMFFYEVPLGLWLVLRGIREPPT
jgi:hypothetical protein